MRPGPIRKEPIRKEHDRRSDHHGRARKYELAQKSEDGGQHEKEGNPVGDAAHKVPVVFDREGKFGFLVIEKPIGDLQVQQGIRGEQDPDDKTKSNGTRRATQRPPTPNTEDKR